MAEDKGDYCKNIAHDIDSKGKSESISKSKARFIGEGGEKRASKNYKKIKCMRERYTRNIDVQRSCFGWHASEKHDTAHNGLQNGYIQRQQQPKWIDLRRLKAPSCMVGLVYG